MGVDLVVKTSDTVLRIETETEEVCCCCSGDMLERFGGHIAEDVWCVGKWSTR